MYEHTPLFHIIMIVQTCIFRRGKMNQNPLGDLLKWIGYIGIGGVTLFVLTSLIMSCANS